MSVIKATDLLARRARPPEIRVPVLAAPQPSPIDPVRLKLEHRIEALEEALAEAAEARQALEDTVQARVAELAEAEARGAAEAVEARQAGREAGFAEGSEAKAEALERLERGATRAMDQLRADLRGMETLAVALAKAGLAKVFGDDRDMANRVTRLVRRQLDGLERAAVLRVEVSAEDFPDAAAVAALGGAAGLDGIEVKALATLGPGDCRMRLRLGELEVGMGQQWARLSALLDETLAAEPGP